jgi:predicted molibdopterin-dependent oxidoreductase YjgC
MFKTLGHPDPRAPRAVVRFEGREIEAREGDNLAAVLLGAGEVVLRHSPVSDAPRGPFCMMGVCFECLVELDGLPGQQACTTSVRDGMDVRRDSLRGGTE